MIERFRRQLKDLRQARSDCNATLLPSATEIVSALGHTDSLVGVSHSCRLPGGSAAVPVMTSTRVPVEAPSGEIDSFVRDHLASQDALYDLDVEALAAANPDVVVSQALCDVCAVSTGDVDAAIHSLPSHPTLVDLEPNTLDDVLEDILRVGAAIGATDKARTLVAALVARRDAVATRSAAIAAADRPGVAFLEWLDPPFNGGHWNPELVELAGGRDLLGTAAKPSQTLDWDTVVNAQPEVVFVACCGFDVERTLVDLEALRSRPEWQSLPAVRTGRVYVADASRWFASPGPGLLDGLEIMAHAFHPDIHPRAAAGDCLVAA